MGARWQKCPSILFYVKIVVGTLSKSLKNIIDIFIGMIIGFEFGDKRALFLKSPYVYEFSNIWFHT